MLRRMVNSHARRLVPGWNLSDLLHALSSVSWTRSSASEADPDSEIANARKFTISATSSSLKLALGIAAVLLLRRLQSSQQLEEFFRKRSGDQIVVMRLQRASDRIQNLWIERGLRHLGVHGVNFRLRHGLSRLFLSLNRCNHRLVPSARKNICIEAESWHRACRAFASRRLALGARLAAK